MDQTLIVVALIGGIAQVLAALAALFRNPEKPSAGAAEKFARRAKRSSALAVAMVGVMVVLLASFAWWQSHQAVIGAAHQVAPNQTLQADTAGIVTAFIQYPDKPGADSLLVGYVGALPKEIDDQAHKVAFCEAYTWKDNSTPPVGRGDEGCSIAFPVPKGAYYKVTAILRNHSYAVDVRFFPVGG